MAKIGYLITNPQVDVINTDQLVWYHRPTDTIFVSTRAVWGVHLEDVAGQLPSNYSVFYKFKESEYLGFL